MKPITPCLWFDTQGEEAAKFYTSLFENSRIVDTTYYAAGMPQPEGSVMTVAFELNGQPFTALNGGPDFTFDEAVSFEIPCENQEQVDKFWNAFAEGGEESRCGWIKDRFGVSWQVVPTRLTELFAGPDPAGVQRAVQAMMQMRKLDIAALEKAYAGE
ncbi:VOC family protein [Rhodococcus triatomae]|uniref:Glyoxalase superfamily enzyme, possibly 3-demethylubiquinone-9 3-methyltransferase n=1 Tax=Rhodococcus triatomae TaxID=300028 RepID=A0A1G8SG53_9NOCA|nr:VOC family protein [Rhodococcus triatomae]QNG20700.1 VOC family protein [Rhodococcus triatomae]QNG23382.1 VOC family protein [Rhodococcus triatomae]SDJ28198.1 Glyoxalase superfamily enzyme, possibly 3-demethylubiquinone-9 3-methyltransferase [Rhodococcus triatomae]